MSVLKKLSLAAVTAALPLFNDASAQDMSVLTDMFSQSVDQQSRTFPVYVEELGHALLGGGDISIATKNMQIFLEEKRMNESYLQNHPEIKADGILGPKTAKAILDMALETHFSAMLFPNYEDEESAEYYEAVSGFLRDQAPSHFRRTAFAFVNGSEFQQCMVQNVSSAFNPVFIGKEFVKIVSTDNYKTVLIPKPCQPYMEYPLSYAGKSYVESILFEGILGDSLLIPEEVWEWCDEATYDDSGYNVRCLQPRI